MCVCVGGGDWRPVSDSWGVQPFLFACLLLLLLLLSASRNQCETTINPELWIGHAIQKEN